MRKIKLLFTILFGVFILLNVNAQEVILIRHAAVEMHPHGWMGAKKAAKYKAAYDTSPVHQFAPDTVLAKVPRQITDTVYVSGLPRSIATGIKLYGNSASIVSTETLNEYEMHMIWLPLVLPYKGWTSLSRIMWLMGLEKPGTESYREAKERTRNIADFIEKKAKSEKQVIFVTHGFLNRNLAKELKKRGWIITTNNGKKNLGATILKK